jgi:hypothetical protein
MKRAHPILLAFVALLTLAHPAAPQPSMGTGEAAVACPTPLRLGQIGLTDPHADFARAAQLTGVSPGRSFLIRRSGGERGIEICADEVTTPWSRPPDAHRLPGGLEVEWLPLVSSSHYNTAYPRDRNYGVLWAGRGLSAELHGGLALRWGPLSAAAAPTLHYSQNRAYEIIEAAPPSGFSRYIYRGHPHNIDWPQRPGDRPISGIDAGQSYLRLDASHLALGLSNENLWWGPARRHPLLMSNTAPGFPHIFLGSSDPVDLWIGHLEGQAIWGRLQESEYFDNNPANDRRLLAGLVVSFEPRWVRGLYLGAARSYLREVPVGGLSTSDWLLSPYRGIRDNPLGRGHPEADNQLFSVFARWAPPRSGFEAYFEFARDDHWEDLEDLIAEPEVSGAYTLGFQKVLPRGEHWLRIAGELTQIADPLPTLRRPLFTIYTHGQLRQGYTHRGRLLGAAIGPSANAQFLGVDLFTPSGRRGVFVERIRYDVDANREQWERRYGAAGADVEWSIGIDQHLFLPRFDLGWSLTHSYRRNRHYLGLFAAEPYFHTERNWSLRFDLAWRPGSRAPLTALRESPAPVGGRP